jgi:hypothetical protein
VKPKENTGLTTPAAPMIGAASPPSGGDYGQPFALFYKRYLGKFITKFTH